MINCGVEDWFTIMFDNKPAGEILLSTKFEPVGGNAYDQMKAEFETQQEELRKEAEAAQAQLG